MSEQVEAEKPSLLAGLIILIVVVVGIVGWIAIGTMALKLTSFYASFLFLWYWSTVDKLDFKKILPSMIGAMLGIGLAWMTTYLPAVMGTNGLILALVLILIAIYLVVIERLPFAFNPALTLYLTVVAAPALLETSDFRELAVATLLGGGFFAAFVFAAVSLAAMFNGGAKTEA